MTLSNSPSQWKKRNIRPLFPKKADPLFCSFDKAIAKRINRAGFCFYLPSHNINDYDLAFCRNKEVWVCCLNPESDENARMFAYSLLRHGATKVQVQYFPLEGITYV
jgi:hypothetical protein